MSVNRKPIDITSTLSRSPLLAQLNARAQQARQLLDCVRASLPAPLQACVAAGPLEGDTWCVIAPNAAVAARLKYCQPAMLAALEQSGNAAAAQVRKIRVRIARDSAGQF